MPSVVQISYSTSATSIRKISTVNSLGENKKCKVTGNSLSTVRPEANEIIQVCTYPVITAAEIDMFVDLTEVRNAHGQYRDMNRPSEIQ